MSSKTFLIAFLPCLLAACQNGPYGPSAVDSRQFDDVVVPSGFRLRDRAHESFSRVDATYRQGHWVYLGNLRVEEAAAHVVQNMPRHSWRCVSNEVVDEDAKRMRFERGIYSADYVLRRTDGRTEMIVDYETDYSRR